MQVWEASSGGACSSRGTAPKRVKPRVGCVSHAAVVRAPGAAVQRAADGPAAAGSLPAGHTCYLPAVGLFPANFRRIFKHRCRPRLCIRLK